MHKLHLFQGVVLESDLAEPCVGKGTPGVVVEMLEPDGVAVEFFDPDGATIDVALIPEALVRPATPEEVAQARALTRRLNRNGQG